MRARAAPCCAAARPATCPTAPRAPDREQRRQRRIGGDHAVTEHLGSVSPVPSLPVAGTETRRVARIDAPGFDRRRPTFDSA